MTQILAFVSAHMGFLWESGRFRIAASDVQTSNGGDAWLEIESSRIRIRIVRDRSQLFLDLQPAPRAEPHWFSIDLVRRLVLGGREESAVLDESFVAFLETHLEQIEDLFSASNWSATMSRLKQVKRQRAKEMFG